MLSLIMPSGDASEGTILEPQHPPEFIRMKLCQRLWYLAAHLPVHTAPEAHSKAFCPTIFILANSHPISFSFLLLLYHNKYFGANSHARTKTPTGYIGRFIRDTTACGWEKGRSSEPILHWARFFRMSRFAFRGYLARCDMSCSISQIMIKFEIFMVFGLVWYIAFSNHDLGKFRSSVGVNI